MSSSMMECSNCSEQFPTEQLEFLENGNVVCPDCKRKEVENTKEE